MVDKDFKLIVVTPENIVDFESVLIMLMLDNGIDRVHLRHPGATADEIADLIFGIPQRLYHRLSLHDHHELLRKFPSIWPHVNSRNPLTEGVKHYTRSCHDFDEANDDKDADYCFVSPIFDSVSKIGYKSRFGIERLRQASEHGLISSKMIALGGVDPDKFPLLRELGFGGAAMLGYMWADNDFANIIKRINAAVHNSH